MIRHHLKAFRRSPGFFLVATLSLGTAIGLSTAVFALVDSVTHPTSSYKDASRLFEFRLEYGPLDRKLPYPSLDVQLREARGSAAIESATAAYDQKATIQAGELTADSRVNRVAPNYFSVLGATPRIGRLPTPQEIRDESAAVVSEDFWRSAFHNRRSIDGAMIAIDGHVHPIVGVIPTDHNRSVSADWIQVFLPVATEPALAAFQANGNNDFSAFTLVRIKPGISVGEVSAIAGRITSRFDRIYSTPARPFGIFPRALLPDPLGLRGYQWAMLSAAAAILLMACMNISALLLARGISRRRDYALRLALGASHTQLAWHVFSEVLVVAVIGGVAGVFIGFWGIGTLTSVMPQQMIWLGLGAPVWSARVFAAAAAFTLFSLLIAGAIPAWRAARLDPAEPLKDGSFSSTVRTATRFRILVMAELALSLALLIGSTLIIKGTHNIEHFDFGYDAQQLLTAEMAGMYSNASSSVTRLDDDDAMVARARNVPGVIDAAAWAKRTADHNIAISDGTVQGGAPLQLYNGYLGVGAHFIKTLGVQIVEGRDFAEGDRAGGGAVILDQRAAAILFPNGHALGGRVKMGDLHSARDWMRVVGIVRTARLVFPDDPDLDKEPTILASEAPRDAGRSGILVRPAANAPQVAATLAAALREAMPPGSATRVTPWLMTYQRALIGRQFISRVFVLLGLVSLALGAAGLFSVMAYAVSQRMREFAVRIALGASPAHVLRIMAQSALELVIGGTAIGAFIGMKSGFLLQEYLYGVYPVDVGALVLAEVILVVAMCLACVRPVLKAMRADPVDMMRAT